VKVRRNPSKIKLAPSILSADFGRLGEQVAEATEGGADYIHIDVMDGQFVPNITVGAPVVKAIRSHTNLPLDVHLMVEKPHNQISFFAEAKVDIMTVHAEVCPHLHRTVDVIRKMNIKAGVSLNPGSPLSLIEEVLPTLDLVLLMTVNPGFGGQALIKGVLDKISRLRQRLDRLGLKAELEVDGGINTKTAPQVVESGATVLVAGTAIFDEPRGVKAALQQMRDSLYQRKGEVD
jgi:ribulose-phosphate 3-epimerase